MVDYDIAYYEYYNYETVAPVKFTLSSGETEECYYYYYTPRGMTTDESTPVVAYVTHGGGFADEERAIALDAAANQDTQAVIINPCTDIPEAVCACLDDAAVRLRGKGNFDNISFHGTSSGGRAIIRAALKSTDPNEDYHFRIGNIFAYDPASQTGYTNITGQTARLRAMAEQGTVLIMQTDTDETGYFGGSALHCNEYARVYSWQGGIAIVAQCGGLDHEGRFTGPLTHNSINWAIGRGEMSEDMYYQNDWYYYRRGMKIAATFEEVTEILRTGELPTAESAAVSGKEPDKPRETAAPAEPGIADSAEPETGRRDVIISVYRAA